MTTSADKRMGWVPPENRSRAVHLRVDVAISGMSPFYIVGAKGADDSEGKRVVLWDAARKVLGKDVPCFEQEIGDCVSMGACNALNYLQCVEILRGDQEEFQPAYQPFSYGISRVQVGGGRLSGDGSIGAWAAEGHRRFGCLFTTDDGCPPYSGSVARQWGKRPGPPQKFLGLAVDNLLHSTALMSGYTTARQAICNGFPVTVASDQGFLMRPVVDKGKHWGKASGSWAHQMCFIGVDDDSRRPGCYCMNSWGPNAHGKPADDAPAGGFWVDAEVVDRMIRQQDSFAYSQFDGFPKAGLDFTLISR